MKALEGGGEIGGRRMGKMEEKWRGGGWKMEGWEDGGMEDKSKGKSRMEDRGMG